MKNCFRKWSVIAAAVIFLSGSLPVFGNVSYAQEPADGTEVLLEEGAWSEETPIIEENGGHDSFDESLLMEAAKKDGTVSLQNVAPVGRTASLAGKNEGHVLCFHVNFPNDPEAVNQQFAEGDDTAALSSALGRSFDGTEYTSAFEAPYDSLYSYYQRSSYGSLSLDGFVYEYSAQYPRDSYQDTDSLFTEILTAMNDQIDYRAFDADNDGVIDCIVLHIPEDTSIGWGDKWWPSCGGTYTNEMYDGLYIGSKIILSRNMSQRLGVQTLIHEVGHAIGFPDYYSYEMYNGASFENGIGGIGTFDMMFDDQGDHNGFSKWVAGWLKDENITRVTANETGVRATRGGVPAGIKNQDGSVTLELKSFDSDDPGKTGGIIVVSNEDQGLFSSYYMIQYDTFAGNEKVYYAVSDREYPLPSGFRVFRVQADMDAMTGSFLHTNTYGSIHNQLIELVDPDMDQFHKQEQDYISKAAGQKYNCMFFENSVLSPVTTPSTNFMENIRNGFTGITIEFLSTGETSGTLKISYSDEHKPEILPLELTAEDVQLIPGGCEVKIRANQPITLGGTALPHIRIENEGLVGFLRNMQVKDDMITGMVYIDADRLKPSSKVSLFFPQGFFLDGGKESSAMEISLPVAEDLIDLKASGTYADTHAVSETATHLLSQVFKDAAGNCYFYGYSYTGVPYVMNSTVIRKYTFRSETPEQLITETLEAGSAERAEAAAILEERIERFNSKAAVIPNNAELGDYPYVADAVEMDGMYYVLSYQDEREGYLPDNQLAFSLLDKNGKQIRQVIPFASESKTAVSQVTCARLKKGPHQMLAVVLYDRYPLRDSFTGVLEGNMKTLFYDQTLSLKGRMGSFSTGCGTWLDDGRYLFIGQRNADTQEDVDAGIVRSDAISYDISGVLDPFSTPDADSHQITGAVLSKHKFTYNGKQRKPSVTVTDEAGNPVPSSCYSVTYSGNIRVGTAKAVIKGKGNYTGTVTKTFKINPKKTRLKKLAAIPKGFLIKWKRQSAQTTGYQIQYAADKSFKSGKQTVTVKKNRTVSKKIGKLKPSKKYYVRIRTYKKVKGKKYYSGWSKVKSIRTG